MLMWWLTLCTSLKPLANMVTRLIYAGAFLYLTQDSNNTATQQQRHRHQQEGIAAFGFGAESNLSGHLRGGTSPSQVDGTKTEATQGQDEW